MHLRKISKMKKNAIRKYLHLVALLLVALLLGACGPDPIPEPDPTDSEDVQVNKWTYQILSYYYLWNEEVKNITPAYETDYQSFLSNTLGRLTSNSLDGKIHSGSRMFYSYITATPISRSSVEWSPIYGMSIIAYGFNIQMQSGKVLRYFARIQYVTPGSPAEKAGLKRGDWIGRVDGKQLLATNFSDINKLLPSNSTSVKVLYERRCDLPRGRREQDHYAYSRGSRGESDSHL